MKPNTITPQKSRIEEQAFRYLKISAYAGKSYRKCGCSVYGWKKGIKAIGQLEKTIETEGAELGCLERQSHWQ